MSDIVVIGAGASGLMAALNAASCGASVTVIEKNSKIGKKLLATGNGRCNITNLAMDISKYRTDNPQFVERLLEEYTVDEIIKVFEALLIKTKDINGYVYPYSLQAQTVVDKLYNWCNSCRVNFILNAECVGIEKNKNEFNVKYIKTEEKNEINAVIKAKKVIVSTGLVAGIGVKGEKINEKDIFALNFARKTGHNVSKIVPGLTGLKCRNAHQAKVSGVRWESKVSTYVDGAKVYEDRGELQFADYGISGIVVFQNARYASYALAEKKKVAVEIDLMPDYSYEEFYNLFNNRLENFPNASLYDVLSGIYNNKLVNYILLNAKLDGSVKMKKFNEKHTLADGIKALKLEVIGTRGFEFAQVCAGGIDTADINDNMESKHVKGLYFTGEVLDVDGMCGGYNLHFAFATGIKAGTDAGSNV